MFTRVNMGYRRRSNKEVRIIIYCSRATRRRLRAFKELMGFEDYEKAINYLLDYYEGKVIRSF